MDGRTLVVLAVAVLAGCGSLSAVGDTPTPERTVTPAPVPTTVTETTPEPPAGLSMDGIRSASALSVFHRRAVTERAYVWQENVTETVIVNGTRLRTVRENTTAYVQNGTVYREETSLLTVDSEGVRRWTNRSQYADNEQLYTRRVEQGTGGNPVEFDFTPIYDRTDRFAHTASSAVEQYLQLRNVSVTRVERNGSQWYSVVGTGSNWLRHSDATSYRAVAVVDDEGIVRRLSVEYVAERNDRRRVVSYSFRYRRIGNVTVTRPEWLPKNLTGPRPEGG